MGAGPGAYMQALSMLGKPMHSITAIAQLMLPPSLVPHAARSNEGLTH